MALARQILRDNHGRCGQDWNLSPQYVSCFSYGGNRAVYKGFSCTQLAGCSIGNLGDVDMTGVVDGAILTYGTSNKIWSASRGCDVVATCDIGTLRNVDIEQPLGGDMLVFNSTNGTWVNQSPSCVNCCFDTNIGVAGDILISTRVFYGCIVPWPADPNSNLLAEFYIYGEAGQEGECYIPINAFSTATNLWGIPATSTCGNTVFIIDQNSFNFTLTGEGTDDGMIATYNNATVGYLFLAYSITIGAPDGLLTVIDSDFEGDVILYINGSPTQTKHIIGRVTNTSREYSFANTFYYDTLTQNDIVAIYWRTTKDPQDTTISLLRVAYSTTVN